MFSGIRRLLGWFFHGSDLVMVLSGKGLVPVSDLVFYDGYKVNGFSGFGFFIGSLDSFIGFFKESSFFIG